MSENLQDMPSLEEIIAENVKFLLDEIELLPEPSRGAYKIRLVFDIVGWTTALKLGKHATENLGGKAPDGIFENINKVCYHSIKNEQIDIFYPNSLPDETVLPTIVWVHGGAWISGSKSQIANYLKIIASYGYTVVGVNYSLAPEDTYPTPLIQVNDAIKYLLDDNIATKYHIDKDKFALAGDSAGSQIAAQMATTIANPNYVTALADQTQVNISPALEPSQLKCIVLCCGGYNLDSINLTNPYFKYFIDTVMWSYSGTKDFRQDSKFETFSVCNYVDENFPPSFITVGDADPLHDQSVELNAKLQGKGVQTDTLIYNYGEGSPKLNHEYQFDLDDEGGYGRIALDRITAFLNTHLGT
ncbi:alpha/beta hydrolase [Microseira wollei]|nr:alpha/beta hydrolase [Microseira wollei]